MQYKLIVVSFGCGAPIFNAWSIIFDFVIKISPEALVLGPSGGHHSIQRGKLHKIDMGAINCWGIFLEQNALRYPVP